MKTENIVCIVVAAALLVGAVIFLRAGFARNPQALPADSSGSGNPQATSTAEGQVPAGQNGFRAYANAGYGISMEYPDIAVIDDILAAPSYDWQYGSNVEGVRIAQFTIPKSFQPQTNFGEARITIGASTSSEALGNCSKPVSSAADASTTHKTINGVDYFVTTGGDAGAGNFYDITSYRAVINKTCYSIDQIIHSTNIQNYSPDAGIKEFDRQKAADILNQMIATLKIAN